MVVQPIYDINTEAGIKSTTVINNGGASFLSHLKELFEAPDNILAQMADPDVTHIYLEGLGLYDKNDASFQLASSVLLSRTDAVLQSILSTVKFKYDIAKAADSLVG